MPRDFMDCGGKRSATPLWLLFVSHASPNQLLGPKRRRASLAAALHMALTDTLNRTPGEDSACWRPRIRATISSVTLALIACWVTAAPGSALHFFRVCVVGKRES